MKAFTIFPPSQTKVDSIYFRGGDVIVGLEKTDRAWGISLKNTDEPKQIGDLIEADGKPADMVLLFDKPESIDVLIKRLQECKQRIIDDPPVWKPLAKNA